MKSPTVVRGIGLALLLVPSVLAAGDPLADGFSNPPESAKPRTWWHWVSGNVSREGITADLEAMKSIGLGGAQMFTVDQSDVKGPVVFMSPQWRQLVQHAISESDRLGLEFAMENGEGWCESGGPWVTPAQSMQQVVWSEACVEGGGPISLSLPQPLTVRGYYEDIALFAFPARRGDVAASEERITTSGNAAAQAGAQTWGLDAPLAVPAPEPGHPQWIQFEFKEAQVFSSFRIETPSLLRDNPGPDRWALQVSGDGRDFRKVCDLAVHGTTTFGEVSGRYFRLWLPVLPPRATGLSFTELVLAGPRLDKPEAHAGMEVDRGVNRFRESPFPTAGIIPAGGLIDLTGRTEWSAPPGHWTLIRIGHTSTGIENRPASPATVGLECDKLSAEAVTSHFENGMLGTVIADAGALTGRGLRYVLCDSWEVGCENWTPRMREEFKARRGYDLQPWLPVLTGRVVGSVETSERFLWDYRRTLADLVADHHYGVLQQLAHRNHLGLYAEAVGINLPTIADELQCKGRTDIPMGEFWAGEFRPGSTPIDDTKEAASAAHIYGQNIAGAEAYTARPEFGSWAQDPYSLKAMGDLELCLGINRFIFHRYAHQPWLDRKPGMSMGPWGTNFERTNTWWQPAAAWMSYLSRCQYLLQQGSFAADVCYFYGEGAPVDVKTAAFAPSLPHGYDCDACNAEILLRATVTGGRVTLPSGMSYRVLVLPETDRMTVPVAEKIRDLVGAGATVVGPKPVHSPSLTNFPASDRSLQAIAEQVWGDCDGRAITEHHWGAGRMIWGRPLAEALAVGPDFASEDDSLRFIHRHAGDAEIYFISNQESREVMADCTFRVAGRIPELWHPDTGRRETLAFFQNRDGRTTLPLHLDPVGSVFVIFRNSSAAADPVVSVRKSSEAFAFPVADAAAPMQDPPTFRGDRVVLTTWSPGSFVLGTTSGMRLEVSAADFPPPLRLGGTWTVAFPPGLGAPSQIQLDQLRSWTEVTDEGVKHFSGTATYAKDFDLPAGFFGADRRQFIDLGAVKNLARVRLNGRDLGVLWKEPFRTEITGPAKPGRNRLEVEVTNLWPNRLIGDASLPPERRITWASVSPYKAGMPLLASGLLGPVLIRAADDIVAKKSPQGAGYP